MQPWSLNLFRGLVMRHCAPRAGASDLNSRCPSSGALVGAAGLERRGVLQARGGACCWPSGGAGLWDRRLRPPSMVRGSLERQPSVRLVFAQQSWSASACWVLGSLLGGDWGLHRPFLIPWSLLSRTAIDGRPLTKPAGLLHGRGCGSPETGHSPWPVVSLWATCSLFSGL